MRRSDLALSVIAVIATVVSFPDKIFAQAQAKYSFDAIVNCHQPSLQNYPIHGEGTGRLSTDGTAALDVDSNVEGRQEYDLKLGGRPIATPGGSATLRVASRHSLRVVRDYPNNIMVLELKVVGRTCAIRVESRLKPGRREYTFATRFGLAYCDRPIITKTTCGAF
jgi:hypothetical protein